jgi:hypothetical protein
MAPSVDISPQPVVLDTASTNLSLKSQTESRYVREPLKYSGSLDEYKSFDVTPVIGREFSHVQLTDILNDDQKLRDLAITGESSDQVQRNSNNPLISLEQCLAVVLSSFETKTLTPTSRRSWDRNLVN